MSKLEKFSDNIDSIVIAKCRINPRGWEDACVDGERDDDWDNPKIPCVETIEGKHPYKAWCPIINLKTRQIENWKEGVTAETEYKSCDENEIDFCDKDGNVIARYEGYVPEFLSPDDKGWGDYIYMTIDEKGFIKKFNPNLDDIFKEK